MTSDDEYMEQRLEDQLAAITDGDDLDALVVEPSFSCYKQQGKRVRWIVESTGQYADVRLLKSATFGDVLDDDGNLEESRRFLVTREIGAGQSCLIAPSEEDPDLFDQRMHKGWCFGQIRRLVEPHKSANLRQGSHSSRQESVPGLFDMLENDQNEARQAPSDSTSRNRRRESPHISLSSSSSAGSGSTKSMEDDHIYQRPAKNGDPTLKARHRSETRSSPGPQHRKRRVSTTSNLFFPEESRIDIAQDADSVRLARSRTPTKEGAPFRRANGRFIFDFTQRDGSPSNARRVGDVKEEIPEADVASEVASNDGDIQFPEQFKQQPAAVATRRVRRKFDVNQDQYATPNIKIRNTLIHFLDAKNNDDLVMELPYAVCDSVEKFFGYAATMAYKVWTSRCVVLSVQIDQQDKMIVVKEDAESWADVVAGIETDTCWAEGGAGARCVVSVWQL